VGTSDEVDWVTRTASEVIGEAERRHPGAVVVCASGISPSGPIHLGNLREVMVPHLVADEVRRRGVTCEHILSWDDYDRLRKIPEGAPASFAEYIGQPLTSVPDPHGEYSNWAERFKAPFREALRRMGVELREISQTEMYRSGVYAAQILRALDQRKEIGAVLDKYRTANVEQAEAQDGIGDYYPYRPYCHSCGRDGTVVLGYDPLAAKVDYRCPLCGHHGTDTLRQDCHGKLAWKIDWPMRWAHEQVTFESGGVDHSSPGSSFTVGCQIVREVYGGQPPVYLGYSFVGTRGAAKMSSSTGGTPTPLDALSVLEAPILRWLYARRRPNQSITIDLGGDAPRLYDEWDSLGQRVGLGTAEPWEAATYGRAVRASAGALRVPRHVVPFKVLTSIIDITAGSDDQISRVLATLQRTDQPVAIDDVEPRLALARAWLEAHVPLAERTHVRTEPDAGLLKSLPETDREAIHLLLDRLDEHWTLSDLTRLVYGVAKLQFGLDLTAEPTSEIKQRQKEFFGVLYRLLVGTERGPRLPTLMLAIGTDRVRSLLTPSSP
jgi:lysyl-tRNA synthetase class 1